MQVQYTKNIVLLRGNHECRRTNAIYGRLPVAVRSLHFCLGFRDECLRRYKSIAVWEAFQKAFDCMPIAALIGERILW